MDKLRCQICGKELTNSFFKITENGTERGICFECFNALRARSGQPELTKEEFEKGLMENKVRFTKKVEDFRKAYNTHEDFLKETFPETYKLVKDNMDILLEYDPENPSWLDFLLQLWIIMAEASQNDKRFEKGPHKVPIWCGKMTNMLASKIDRLKFFEQL